MTKSGRGGTLNYIAPEILNGEPYNAKSDLFALGCIVYELCTLNLAFTGQIPHILVKITNGEYEPIHANLPYSDGLKRLVDLLL